MQPNWKMLYCTDCERLEQSEDGKEVCLEIADETENGTFHLYRLDVERFKLIADADDPLTRYLVPAEYNETWPHASHAYKPWFAEHLADVALSAGEDPQALILAFTSEDPKARAGAYSSLIGYFGAFEFDQYPLELTEDELDARWAGSERQ
jgi:hypothetical protein